MTTFSRGPRLLGLDVGTTHVKCALVSDHGRELHVARRPTPTRVSRGAVTGHPAGELLAAVEAVIRECIAAAEAGGPIEGLGIASMAEAGALVGPGMRPITEIIPWFDPRSDPEAAELGSSVGAAQLFRTTGLRAHGKYSLPKLMWLRRHRPAVIRRAAAWAGVAELVAVHLTGRLATNASLACRTLAFDVSTRRWSPDLLAFAGLEAAAMPEVLPFGQRVGGILPGPAARLGLPPGLPVTVAGHDHVVGGFGAGIVDPGDALDSMGGAEACLVVTERPVLDDGLRVAGYSVGCHAVDGTAYVLAGLQSSGAVVEWFIDSFLGDLPDAERYPAFMRLLATVPASAGPGAIVALPYLRGRTAPSPDPVARLELRGMGQEAGLAEIAAALVDGAACAVRWIFDEMERVASIRVARATVIGGGVRNERWMAAKAALSPWPLRVAPVEEAAAFGAALAGGIAAGLYGSPADALRGAARGRRVSRPRGHAAYERFYRERFLPLAAR